MITRARKREVFGLNHQATGWTFMDQDWGSNPSVPNANYTVRSSGSGHYSLGSPLRGLQVTVDENHGSIARSLRGPYRGDIGGPFLSTKSWCAAGDSSGANDVGLQLIYSPLKWVGHWNRERYFGPVLAYEPNLGSIPVVDTPNLSAKGATAIARCKPTNNVSNLAVDLIEMYRDGLPTIWGSTLWKERTRAAKAAGGEYLNTEFGWEPLVADIRNASYAAANAHRLLEAYERNSGKVVRRSYEFPIEQTEVSVNMGPSNGYIARGMDPWVVDAFKIMPNLIKTTKFYRRTWFSGAFTYHLPIGYTSRNGLVSAAAKAGPLLGIELTPEVVWQALPWSWAANWFSNLGDVINNVSDWATDGLTMKWGYIMEHTIASVTYSLSGRTTYMDSYPFASPVTFFYERKRREKASPFGFGLTWPQFTPRQLAITAALGIRRVF